MSLQSTLSFRDPAVRTTDRGLSSATAGPQAAPRRSRRAIQAMLAIIITVPVALLSQVFWANGAGALIHFGLAAGMFLLAAATVDFQTSRWAARLGSTSAVILGAVFLLQGVYDATQIEGMKDIVYGILGQGLESVLMYGVIIWGLNLLRTDSSGKTRIFGVVVLGLMVTAEAFSKGMSAAGGDATEVLKVLYLLFLPWMLLEGSKRRAAGSASNG